jgi:Na+-driven multidrug efflux pump
VDGLAVAGQALVAKNLGARRAERADQVGKKLIFWGCAAGLGFGIIYFSLKEPLIRIFTGNSDVIRILGADIFLLLALSQPLNGIVFALDGCLMGAHDTRFLMWAMLIGAVGIFTPMTWLSLQMGFGLFGIWVGLTLFMFYRLSTNLFRLLNHRWVHVFPGKA